jgi:hypothetical protein
MPGFGSLMAGRISGYAQAALGLGGMALTTLFAARFIGWYVANSSRFSNIEGDPWGRLFELWLQLRWPLLGIAVFLAGWLWALVTSLLILHEAKHTEPPSVPPLLRKT